MAAESCPGGRHTHTGWGCWSDGPRICSTLTVPRSPAASIVSELASLVTPDGSTISTQNTPTTAVPSSDRSTRRTNRPPWDDVPIGSDTARTRRLSGAAVAPEVALELAGDRVAARLGQVHRVLGLFQGAHVVGDLGILLGELVHASLPGARLLGQVGQRQRYVQDVLDAAQQRQRGLRARRLRHVVRHLRPQ